MIDIESRVAVVILVLLAGLLPQPSLLTTLGSGYTPSVVWSAYSNPSPNEDLAFAVCHAGDVIYVVGSDEALGNPRQRIEVRSKSSGDFLLSWVNNPSDYDDVFHDCVVVSDRLIVVGVDTNRGSASWVIAEFSLGLTLNRYVRNDLSPWLDVAASIVSDGAYVYIAGADTVPGDMRWRVEKRRASDLELLAVYTSNPSSEHDWALGIGINPINGFLWVVGDNYSKRSWRIEILDPSLKLVRAVEPPSSGWARGIAFSEDGYAYVAGMGGVARFDPWGNLLKFVVGFDCFKVLYVSGYVYVATLQVVSNYWTQVILVFDKELNLLHRLILDSSPKAPSFFDIGKASHDNRYLYIAGHDEALDSGRWTVYAISLPFSSYITTVTVTTTVTTTAYTTTTVQTRITETKTEPVTIPVTYTLATTRSITIPTTQTVKLIDYVTTTHFATSYSTVTLTTTSYMTTTATHVETISKTLTIGHTVQQTIERTARITLTEAYTETYVVFSKSYIVETVTERLRETGALGVSPISIVVAIAILLFGIAYSSTKRV